MTTQTNGTEAKPAPNDAFPELDFTTGEIGPIEGTVYRCFTHLGFVEFQPPDTQAKEVAMFIPGRMYINATNNMLNVFKTDKMLQIALEIGKTVGIKVQKLQREQEFIFCTCNGQNSVLDKNSSFRVDGDKRTLKQSETRETRTIRYHCHLVWIGPEPKLNANAFPQEDQYMEQLIDKVQKKIFTDAKEEGDGKAAERWFLVHLMGPTPRNHIRFPEQPTKKGVRGIIKVLQKPHGGIIDTGRGKNNQVYFHRTRILLDGFQSGLTDALEDLVAVGDVVMVDWFPNKQADGAEHVRNCSVPNVAHWVHKGKQGATVPEICSISDEPNQNYHRVKIAELSQDEEGLISSGLGIIQPAPIFKAGGASAGMIGEFCKFSNANLSFMGFNLEGIDLSYLVKVGEELSCTITMLEKKQGRAQFEVKAGAVARLASQFSLFGRVPEIIPNMSKYHSKLLKLGCDFTYIERILLKRVPPKRDIVDEGMAVGLIQHLDSAEHNETVSKGLIKIETGPHKDKLVKFSRSKTNLFGYSLDHADLLYIFRPYDIVFCDVSGIKDYADGEYVSQKISVHRLTETIPECEPFKMDLDDRMDFLLWLQAHNLTMKDFEVIVKGQTTSRYYIPFPRDQLPGKVIAFDDTRGKLGCTSGTIKLDGGWYTLQNPGPEDKGMKEMKNVLVTFHRSNFWIYGRKMAKSDLSYVVAPHQKITCEIRDITEDDRSRHPALPKNILYRATIVWIGPSRPRNDRDDPSRNDSGIFDWLAKRNMNIKRFGALIDGKLPPRQPHELGPNNFYLPPPWNDPDFAASTGSADFGGLPQEKLPVLRHGPATANMIEQAIMSGGPEDPRLFRLIDNDEMAQRAHHISKALQCALEYYQKGPGGGGPPMGFMGRGGPPMGLLGRGGSFGGRGGGPPNFGGGRGGFKRPIDVDFTMFGGGYSRPMKRNRGRGRGGGM